LGISAYLTKPVRVRELHAAIAAILTGSGPPLVTQHSLREARSGAKSPLRILLVEDNVVNQRLALRVLEKQGYTVVLADNGRRALSELSKQKFDVVLMDVQMPEMDGLEATAAVREGEKRTGAHIPIIAMTAHAMQDDKQRCLAAGMDAYISKPIRSRDLVELVENFAAVG
jgi:CheY-like chemotaxis protein